MPQNLIDLSFTEEQLRAIDGAIATLEANFTGLIALSAAQRLSLQKMGAAGEPFCRSTVSLLGQNPQIVPPSLAVGDAQADLLALDQLRPAGDPPEDAGGEGRGFGDGPGQRCLRRGPGGLQAARGGRRQPGPEERPPRAGAALSPAEARRQRREDSRLSLAATARRPVPGVAGHARWGPPRTCHPIRAAFQPLRLELQPFCLEHELLRLEFQPLRLKHQPLSLELQPFGLEHEPLRL
jgi:hypothetical protein